MKTYVHFTVAFLMKTVSCEVRAEAEEITDDLEITTVFVFSVRYELKPNEEFKNLNITVGKD